MTLDDLKTYYDFTVKYLVRNNKSFFNDYKRGYLNGAYSIIRQFLNDYNLDDLPELETIEEDDNFKQEKDLELVNKINIFETYYPIYLDDNGQCFCISIDDKIYSFGTYNTDIELSAVSMVFEDIYKKDLIKIDCKES